jgi:RNA polymerase sigma-70 factor (ECF subfamily)
LTVVPVIPLALLEAMKTAAFAISSSVISRRGWVLLASNSCRCYRVPTGGIRHGTGLFVLTFTGDRIGAMTRFDSSVLPWFGLPQSLPD